MRIHYSVACVAIASAAALTAIAAPADAGSAGSRIPERFAAARAAVAAPPACTIKPGAVNVYTTARDVTFSVPGATQEWFLYDNTEAGLFVASDAPSLGDDNLGPTWTFDPRYYKNSEAGKVTVEVFTGADLYNTDEPDLCEAPFSFRRGSKISATLSVKSGYRTVSGKVQSASWGAKPKYVTVNGGIVDVQKKINGAWVTKKTVTTASNGTYSAKIRAAAGDWQAVFRGTSKIGSRTSATKNG